MIQDLEKCGLGAEDQKQVEVKDLHDEIVHLLETAVRNLNRGFKYSAKLGVQTALEKLEELNHE